MINYEEYKESLYSVYEQSREGFPLHLQKNFSRNNFDEIFSGNHNDYIFGAFSKDNQELQGWALLRKIDKYIGFIGLRTIGEAEKYNVNFALIYAIVSYFENDLKDGCYIDDGFRPVLHTTTNFQEYLEKYFQFRKAYSKLHVVYRPGFGLIVHILFPFRRLVQKLKSPLGSNIYGVLLQEEIVRKK